MSKHLVTALKIAILLLVAGLVSYKLYAAWLDVSKAAGGFQLSIDWRWGLVSMAGFSGSIITSALVWRWLAGQMSPDSVRGKTLPLLGAYTYSQMGKYIWKVVLLWMRVERTGRLGMSAGVCTLSTLLENALYMFSGALVGMLAIVRVAGGIDSEKYPGVRYFLWPVTIVVVVGLLAACAPPVFYSLVNRLLRKMKKPEVPRNQWLAKRKLVLAAAAFVPCWIFGGLALWGAARCVSDVPLVDCWWFGGAFALAVIVGMASFLPGGALIREAVVGAAVTIQFQGVGMVDDMHHQRALLLGYAVAVLLRIFQMATESLLGVAGMLLTRGYRQPSKEATMALK